METKLQRMLLVLMIFVLTLALYRDFGNKGTVRHHVKQATVFADVEGQDPSFAALEPANATLGVGGNISLLSSRHILTRRSISSVQSSQSRANNQHVATDFSWRPISLDSTSRSRCSLSGPRKTSRKCVLKMCQVLHEALH